MQQPLLAGKAVALWRAATEGQHVAIVTAYFVAAASSAHGWERLCEVAFTPAAGDPLRIVWRVKTVASEPRA